MFKNYKIKIRVIIMVSFFTSLWSESYVEFQQHCTTKQLYY